MPVVEPGNCLHNYPWNRPNRSQNITGGSSMPLGGSFGEVEIQLVADWIDDGAQP